LAKSEASVDGEGAASARVVRERVRSVEREKRILMFCFVGLSELRY